MILNSVSRWESMIAISKSRVTICTRWRSCEKKLMFITQWQQSIFKKSFTFNKSLFISLSFKSCSCVKSSTMNWFILVNTAQYSYVRCSISRIIFLTHMNWLVDSCIWCTLDWADVNTWWWSWLFKRYTRCIFSERNCWFFSRKTF